MVDEKKIIICPDCGHQSRIPGNKHILFSCPGCDSAFEHKNGILIRSAKQQRTSFGRRLKLIGIKILVGAIITWVLNFFLLKTNWDTWEKFSTDADEYTEAMMAKTLLLSPSSALLNYPGEHKTYGERLQRWVRSYWYKDNGRAFWFGRILVIIVAILTILLSTETYKGIPKKFERLEVFFVSLHIVFRFFLHLFYIFIFLTAFYLVLKILLFISGGVVTLFTLLAAGGGFLKIITDEVRQGVSDSPKNKIMSVILSRGQKRKEK